MQRVNLMQKNTGISGALRLLLESHIDDECCEQFHDNSSLELDIFIVKLFAMLPLALFPVSMANLNVNIRGLCFQNFIHIYLGLILWE